LGALEESVLAVHRRTFLARDRWDVRLSIENVWQLMESASEGRVINFKNNIILGVINS